MGIASIRQNRFLRNVATVLFGTVGAQAIPLLAMLVVTRLITPEEFGVFSVWFGLVYLGSILASGRLEIVVVALAEDRDKETCMAIAAALAVVMATLVGLLVLVLDDLLVRASSAWTADASLALGLTVWASALTVQWTAYAVSLNDYGMVNRIRLLTAGLTAIAQIAAALLDFGHYGLIWGYTVGSLLGYAYGRAWVLRRLADRTGQPAANRLQLHDPWRAFARQHFRAPLFALPASVLNSAALQAPVILSGSLFGTHAAGLIALTMRTLSAPVTVFSASVLDVYRQRASEDFRNLGNCRAAYLQSLRLLVAIAVVPSLVLLLWGPELFAIVYGEEWRLSGVMAQIFVPMLFLRFFASPLGYTLLVTNKAHQELAWQVALLLMTLASFAAGSDVMHTLTWYSTGYALLYVVYLFLSYRAATGGGIGPDRGARPNAL